MEKAYFDIINDSEILRAGFKYILDNSNSLYLPYHNLNHNLTVMTYCYDNLCYEGLQETTESIHLLITALFHDYNHSGGKLTDAENIEKASEGLRNFIEYNKFDIDLNLCNSYLKVTQFPYITEPIGMYEKIIRDSDLCGIFDAGFIQLGILGLKQEMGIIDMKKMFEMELGFISNIKFHTDYALSLKSFYYDDTINEINFLNSLYE